MLASRVISPRSFGNPQGILDLAHRGIVGPQRATWYSREVDVGDGRGVGHGVGAAGHGQGVLLVVAPSRTTQAPTGHSPRCKGQRQGRPENEVAFRRVTIGQVYDPL